jgi:hypothetical protein
MADKDDKTPPVYEPKIKEGRETAKKPIVAPDGHETLSQEDIDARDS